MAVRYEFHTTGYDLDAAVHGAVWKAQTFTPSVAHRITSVKLLIRRALLPGTITVGIRETDGEGHPTGDDLCSGTTDGDTLTDSWPGEWREITLGTGYNLYPDTKYAIVVRAPTGDASNRVRWQCDLGGTYNGGNYEGSYNAGTSWTSTAEDDLLFEEWGEEIVPPPPSPAVRYEFHTTGYDLDASVYGVAWKAQTFTPSVAHRITSVKLLIRRALLPGTITVGIRETDGAGHPTGDDLCSGTTDGDTLTEDWPGEWREITLGAGYNLDADTKYAIVVRAPTGDASNKVVWQCDLNGTYDGGNYEYSSNSGTSWTSTAEDDLLFEEWGEEIAPPAAVMPWNLAPRMAMMIG
ncbi:hypothetical protein ES703_00093 [subsurface metagenome]